MMAVALSLVAVVACVELSPTVVDQDELPGEPITVELQIPWSQFGSNLEVFGGYGSPEDLGEGVVANAFEGTLNARTLLRFGPFPEEVTVRDSTGTSRPDTDLTFIGARFVAFFDTIASTNTGPVTLRLGSTLSEWDAATASWNFAIDTINDQRAWTEPGGGPVGDLGTSVWNPITGDSVQFMLDSATVAGWSDPYDLTAGARLDLIDMGLRLQVLGARLMLQVRPSIAPDTVIEVSSLTSEVTFIYDPSPPPPPDGVRIGGAPAWRTVLDVAVPTTLTGPPEFCAVISCPHELNAGQVSSAALVLTSRATDPAFQPTDTIGLDVRPISNRAAMPKAPLGVSLIPYPFGRQVGPLAFGALAGEQIEVPFTLFARNQLRGTDEDGNPAPGTLALLSVFEPFSLAFASFDGPGSVNEPFLRLVLTIGPSVQLP